MPITLSDLLQLNRNPPQLHVPAAPGAGSFAWKPDYAPRFKTAEPVSG
jgi:hypothetical protein